jgi:hypothetical protein
MRVGTMATRPVFVVSSPAQHDESDNDRPIISRLDLLYKEYMVDFSWTPGISITNKRKNIEALHSAIREKWPHIRILEVSTKSDNPVGRAFSAFNIKIRSKECCGTSECNRCRPFESAYQSSKVLDGNINPEIQYLKPSQAKSHELIAGKVPQAFEWDGQRWKLDSCFYDWLYINAICGPLRCDSNPNIEQLADYDAFTDIEFNPKRSKNTQARACAIAVGLIRQQKQLLDRLFDESTVKDYLESGKFSGHPVQSKFWTTSSDSNLDGSTTR